MEEINLKFDYLHGSIRKDKIDILTGIWATGIDCIDNDDMLQKLNDKGENCIVPFILLMKMEKLVRSTRALMQQYEVN